MEPTTIILTVIFAICGLVLIWAIKNGNNIKFKKKEKKTKSKDSKKEKFKEVIPKEKKEKPDKKKETIRESVKDEKAGKVEPPTNKIMKVTKDDFMSNNISVPKSLGGEDKEKEKSKSEDFHFDAKDLGLLPMHPMKEFDDKDFMFDDKFMKDDFSGLGLNEEDFLKPMMNDDKLLENPFLPMPEDDSLLLGKDMKLGEDLLMDFNNFPPPASVGMPMQSKVKGDIKPESIEERLEKVFGDNISNEPGVKEVIVGDILSGNRSKANRELREKRKKWMK